MVARNVVSRCVKSAMAAAATRRSAPLHLSSARRAILSAPTPTPTPTPTQQLRLCSSSRFLSLADDDGEGKRRRRGEDGEELEGEEGGEELEGEEDSSAFAAGEEGAAEQDGDLALEEEEMYSFCVQDSDELDAEIMALYVSDPAKWTPLRLARKFHMSKQLVEATIFFQAEEAGFTRESFGAKVEEIKAAVEAAQKEQAAKLASAETRGDEKEVKRLQKRDRQGQREASEADEEELTEEEELALLGIDDDFYRNPEFFFLSDEFDGLPPLTRRTGKHKSTDKMYPEEAVELQRLAANNKLSELPSFAKPTEVKSRWKIAVKDISKNKAPLVVRDHDKTLRMATKEEVLPRTWVRRPPFFAGLPN